MFVTGRIFYCGVQALRKHGVGLRTPISGPACSAVVDGGSAALCVNAGKNVCVKGVGSDTVVIRPVRTLLPCRVGTGALCCRLGSGALLVNDRGGNVCTFGRRSQVIVCSRGMLPSIQIAGVVPAGGGSRVLFSAGTTYMCRVGVRRYVPGPFLATSFASGCEVGASGITSVYVSVSKRL